MKGYVGKDAFSKHCRMREECCTPVVSTSCPIRVQFRTPLPSYCDNAHRQSCNSICTFLHRAPSEKDTMRPPALYMSHPLSIRRACKMMKLTFMHPGVLTLRYNPSLPTHASNRPRPNIPRCAIAPRSEPLSRPSAPFVPESHLKRNAHINANNTSLEDDVQSACSIIESLFERVSDHLLIATKGDDN